MTLLHLWALNASVVFLSIKGQKALRFHQKYLHLCSKDYWSYWFGTTWRWVINDRIFIFGCTMPLIPLIKTIIEDSKNIFTFKKKKERKRKRKKACGMLIIFTIFNPNYFLNMTYFQMNLREFQNVSLHLWYSFQTSILCTSWYLFWFTFHAQ